MLNYHGNDIRLAFTLIHQIVCEGAFAYWAVL